jgi:hypothetical protein
MILQRIQPLIDAVVLVSQAGFRKNNRSCTEQVLALTSHKETGFQSKLKTSVWRYGLMLKFKRVGLSQVVKFTEQYVVKPFLPSLSWL